MSAYDFAELEEEAEAPLETDGGQCVDTAAPIGSFMGSVVKRMSIAYSLNDRCESPIEIILGAELTLWAERFPHYRLEPQFVWGRYRIDWAVLDAETGVPVVFIECDGKEFHSSEEAIARDKRRDEACAEAGIKVFRFTGSDIDRNSEFCAHIVFTYLRGIK